MSNASRLVSHISHPTPQGTPLALPSVKSTTISLSSEPSPKPQSSGCLLPHLHHWLPISRSVSFLLSRQSLPCDCLCWGSLLPRCTPPCYQSEPTTPGSRWTKICHSRLHTKTPTLQHATRSEWFCTGLASVGGSPAPVGHLGIALEVLRKP